MSGQKKSQWDLLFLLEASPQQRHLLGAAQHLLPFQPHVDIYESQQALCITVELAGVRPESLDITLSANDTTLLIAGERKERRDGPCDYVRACQLEIYYGPFTQEIRLPADVPIERDRILATCQDGFLQITLPKRENKPLTKHRILVHTEK